MGEPAVKYDHEYTYGEYREWPDDERWELIDGVAWNTGPAPFVPELYLGEDTVESTTLKGLTVDLGRLFSV